MIDIKKKNDCCGCGACSQVCPKDCIKMLADDEGFLYPVVQSTDCINCGLCEKVCPMLKKETHNKDMRDAWGVITKNTNTLLNSSSGGVFTELSQQVLNEGGCVFGAAFADDFKSVKHIMIESAEDLHKLQGSKYIQSEIGNSYREAETQLKNGRKVLFSGTPCQIAGIKGYLKKDYENLFLVDVVCHGTPSQQVWSAYLTSIEGKNKGKAKYVSFRYKEKGWRKFGMKMEMAQGKKYYRSLHEDPFLRVFLKNYFLRESCYACKVKETGSAADITIGDFWGVEKVEPKIDNELGVSLVVIHTEKGKKYFEAVSETVTRQQTDYAKAVSFNSAMISSVKRPPERDQFFLDLSAQGWMVTEKKYAGVNKTEKLKRVLKSSRAGKILIKLKKIVKSTNWGG